MARVRIPNVHKLKTISAVEKNNTALISMLSWIHEGVKWEINQDFTVKGWRL